MPCMSLLHVHVHVHVTTHQGSLSGGGKHPLNEALAHPCYMYIRVPVTCARMSYLHVLYADCRDVLTSLLTRCPGVP